MGIYLILNLFLKTFFVCFESLFYATSDTIANKRKIISFKSVQFVMDSSPFPESSLEITFILAKQNIT